MRWIDRIAAGLGHLIAWVFPVIALMMGYEVVARYAFGAPTFWAHEIAGLLAGVAFVFGGALCMAEGSHMRVTLLYERMRGWRRTATDGLSLLCGTVFLVGLTVAMWGIVERNAWRFGPDGAWNPERSGSSWNTPAPAILKMALLAGAALFLLVVIARIVDLARGRTGADDDAR